MLDTTTLTTLIGAPVRAHEPLARHTSWRVGGPADYFVSAATLGILKQAVQAARAQGLPYFLVGRGTNILVADEGIRGMVIATTCDAYALSAKGDTARLYAEAGTALPLLANTLVKQGWAGLEWAVGIPSAVGSAVVNNAGAHGSCIADVLQFVTTFDGSGQERQWPTSALEFAYRRSRFKGQRGHEVILSAEFLLKRESATSVGERLKKFNEHRRATQPSDPSAGSVFKNPPGDYAGRLIEAAGLKGVRIGGAQVSQVHANFFVNVGAAKASDLVALIHHTQQKVYERFGVQLEPEVELIGFTHDT